MGISEKKMKIVIDNYFHSECNVNTSIRSAFEKGFRIGVEKGLSAQPEPCENAVSRKDCLECLQYKPSLKTKLKKRLKRRGEENEAD